MSKTKLIRIENRTRPTSVEDGLRLFRYYGGDVRMDDILSGDSISAAHEVVEACNGARKSG